MYCKPFGAPILKGCEHAATSFFRQSPIIVSVYRSSMHKMHRRVHANKSITVHMTQVNKYVQNLQRTSIDDQNM